ncbi:MAG: prepilin-type N-terminal cleavage/methylation domain-containing protein [Candidatus Delongbacteria bacterium]|nr:prepilin-type N-terminal cleavage/methylation domain-containing protein [Candidatus Delongbacteria bacterium]MBN2836564.1 prepilin-type N-terminal cleavage/methylation domain-containing protein [Candidatus Delongbacteria bacterium]
MKKGLTLIEALVSSFILSIVIVGLMSIYGSSFKLKEDNEKFFLAENVVREWFEKIKIYTDRTDLITQIGSYVTKLNGTVVENEPMDLTSTGITNGTLEFEVNSISLSSTYLSHLATKPSLVEIKAIVKWGNKELEMVTYSSN